MATNFLVEKAKEQNIQVLQFQNQKLSEQLVNLKQQISGLESNVSKYEDERKRYADTVLCVNRLWEQFNIDVQALVSRCTGQPLPDAARASTSDQSQEPWERFDPFLRRLLASEEANLKQIKRNAQDYQEDLSDVEKALHARSTVSLQALSGLLDLIVQRTALATANQQNLQQLTSDEALNQANQQLQTEVSSLQQQLNACHALQRSTQALLQQSEDRAFEAAENLKSIKNDLADKEYALQAAQRKLQRLKQQQQQEPAGPLQQHPLTSQPSGISLPAAGAADPAGRASTSGGSAATPAAAGGTVVEHGTAVEELQAQLAQLQELLEQRTAEAEAEAEAHSNAQR
eukprot:GHRR01018916.1.p1 GENE.GHRR01018916.1~~GHRR01018916.1.p1  ORF type:complete len:345 (+),score=138.01 GHRR01018916.1:206-1240(+)